MICEVEDESTSVSPLFVTLELGSTRSETAIKLNTWNGFEQSALFCYFVNNRVRVCVCIVLCCLWTREGGTKKRWKRACLFLSPLPFIISTLHSSCKFLNLLIHAI